MSTLPDAEVLARLETLIDDTLHAAVEEIDAQTAALMDRALAENAVLFVSVTTFDD